MPRRRRGFGPGGACCHLTQRCVNGEFRMKFKCDRRNHVERLREGVSRHAVVLLDYVATLNHTHVLVWSEHASEISGLMQYVSGVTAQDYNRRKERRGAYWTDRYHATLVQSERHLGRCACSIWT
jgi:putative transposase